MEALICSWSFYSGYCVLFPGCDATDRQQLKKLLMMNPVQLRGSIHRANRESVVELVAICVHFCRGADEHRHQIDRKSTSTRTKIIYWLLPYLNMTRGLNTFSELSTDEVTMRGSEAIAFNPVTAPR